MTDPHNKIVKTFPSLLDDKLIYRGIRQDEWINKDEDEVKIDQVAFDLRRDKNGQVIEKALSVDINLDSARERACNKIRMELYC